MLAHPGSSDGSDSLPGLPSRPTGMSDYSGMLHIPCGASYCLWHPLRGPLRGQASGFLMSLSPSGPSATGDSPPTAASVSRGPLESHLSKAPCLPPNGCRRRASAPTRSFSACRRWLRLRKKSRRLPGCAPHFRTAKLVALRLRGLFDGPKMRLLGYAPSPRLRAMIGSPNAQCFRCIRTHRSRATLLTCEQLKKVRTIPMVNTGDDDRSLVCSVITHQLGIIKHVYQIHINLLLNPVLAVY